MQRNLPVPRGGTGESKSVYGVYGKDENQKTNIVDAFEKVYPTKPKKMNSSDLLKGLLGDQSSGPEI